MSYRQLQCLPHCLSCRKYLWQMKTMQAVASKIDRSIRTSYTIPPQSIHLKILVVLFFFRKNGLPETTCLQQILTPKEKEVLTRLSILHSSTRWLQSILRPRNPFDPTSFCESPTRRGRLKQLQQPLAKSKNPNEVY